MAAVLLWCASWHQVPAASLPADDPSLCRLAGFGRDLRGWKVAKDAGALHGMVLCSDGRLYHPVVAEKVIQALSTRTKKRAQTAKATEKAAEAKRKQRIDGNRQNRQQNSDTVSVTSSVTDTVTATATDPKKSKVKEREEKKEEEYQAPSHVPNPARELPAVGDPPEKWLPFTQKTRGRPRRNHSGRCRRLLSRRRGGGRVQGRENQHCELAGDWRPLQVWLEHGCNLYKHILPAVEAVAARRNYRPPRTLAYFSEAVMEQFAEHRA